MASIMRVDLFLTLSHNNTAHEDFDRSNSLQWNFALSGSLVKSKLMSQFILTNSVWVIDLVTKYQEWGLRKILHGEKSIEFGLGLGETFVIFSIDKEDYAGNFWEVILPQSSG